MGLFSTKKKTYVNISTQRMLEDADIVPIDKAAILEYVLSKDKRVDALADGYVDYLNLQNANSIGARALGIIKWSTKKYHYGNMVSSLYAEGNVNVSDAVRSYLITLLNDPSVVIEYAKFGPINNLHAAYQILQDQYGFNIKTNTITGGKYLQDIVIYYHQSTVDNAVTPDYLNHLGYAATSGATATRKEDRKRAHTPWEINTTKSGDWFKATVVTPAGVTETIELDFSDYEVSGDVVTVGVGEEDPNQDIPLDADMSAVDEPDYFMIRYSTTNGTKYFTYRFESGVSELDDLFKKDVSPGMHLPQVYIRLKGKDQYKKEFKDTEAFKSSSVLCRKLGMNYTDICEQIMGNADDVSDVKDMFISFRLNINDHDDPIVSEYFYNFFEQLYKEEGARRANSDAVDDAMNYINDQTLTGTTYVVKDNITSMNLSFKGLAYKNVLGSIGPKGTCSSEGKKITLLSLPKRGWGNFDMSVYRHIFRKQITDTIYREYYVDGLALTQKLTTGHSTTVSGDSENLAIPIDVEVVKRVMRKHQHWLINKSINLVITTVKVVKIKWTQRGIFKVIMFVIAVVISFFTGGSGMVWYLALLKAIAIAVVMQVAVIAISKLLTALGVDASIAAVIVAVIAIAVGAYAQAAKTTVAGMTASQLMSVANVSFAVSHNHIAVNMKNELKAFEEFKDIMEDKLDSIEEQRKLLGLDNGGKIDVYTLLAQQSRKPDIRLGETPVAFYERTLSVNVGLATTTLLNNYVYLSLQLPTFESFLAKRGYTDYGVY